MKRLALVLALCGVAWGQASPKHLTCSKYEHFVPAHIESCPSAGLNDCILYVSDSCVSDMHQVTEAEWQQLVALRKEVEALKKLVEANFQHSTAESNIICVGKGACGDSSAAAPPHP